MRILDFADGFESAIQPTIVGVNAGSIGVTPVGSVASTDVQSAIQELDAEKVAKVSSTDNALVRFDGTQGVQQSSGVIVDDSNNVAGVNNLTVSGDLTTQGIKDKNFIINKGGTDSSSEGSGITVDRASAKGSLVYADSASSKFKIGAIGAEKEIVTISDAQTLTNKTLTSPAITTPTGITKADVGLSNVDNTSDATKNSASATLTNKTLAAPILTTPYADVLELSPQASTVSAPSTGLRLFVKSSDGKLYTKDAGGSETQLAGSSGAGVPSGTVLPFAGPTAPTGYLLCDGSAVSRTTYAALYAAIGSTHGAGDGSTTFNLPDTRGVYVRGVGAQTISGIGFGGYILGQKSTDALQGHRHQATNAYAGNPGGGGNAGGAFLTMSTPITGDPIDSGWGGPRLAGETRPATIALNYMIKY